MLRAVNQLALLIVFRIRHRQITHVLFLDPIPERNNKNKLYNDFFTSRNCYLRSNEVPSFGKKLVLTLQNLFWYIGGHHHVFAQRASAIPDMFAVFQNYNRPELSKHRKRITRNISSDQLQDFVLDLSTMLENPYWERLNWKGLKLHFLQLCLSIAGYVEYLHQKNKLMKLVHKSPTPVRDLATNLKITFLSRSQDGPLHPELCAINELVSEKPFFVYVSISEVLPTDPAKKCRVLNTLISRGLSVSCILLVYSPGSNVGNLQFLWRIPENDEPSICFQSSQPVIEEIKSLLPVYHTRAMRRVMFEKFGRVSNNFKPSVLCYFYKDLTGKYRLFC